MNDLLHESIVASIGDLASRAPAAGPTPHLHVHPSTSVKRRAPIYAMATVAVGAVVAVAFIGIRSQHQAPVDTALTTNPSSTEVEPSVPSAGNNTIPSQTVESPTSLAAVSDCLFVAADGRSVLDPSCFLQYTGQSRFDTVGYEAFLSVLTNSIEALPGYSLYIVRPGDSLNRIADAHGVTLDALANANGGDTGIPIVPDMPLLIPPSTTPVVAPTAPKIAIADPAWVMDSIQDAGPTGEAAYTNGELPLDLFWSGVDEYPLYSDETENSALSRATLTIDGHDADVLYRTGYTIAIWVDGPYTLRARMDSVDDDTFSTTIAELTSIPQDEWIAALPPNVIPPANRADSIRSILADVELPPGLDLESLVSTPVVGTYEQLGFRAISTVVCGWIDKWLDANEAGDTATANAAAAALARSHNWAFLIQTPGASQILWNYADAANGAQIEGGSQPRPLDRDTAKSLC